MTGDHPRNTPPTVSGPRCGAKTRSGMPCTAAAVSGKKRCRIHGGAPGSGAPLGNKNALKQGLYTREALAEHRRLQALLRQSRRLVQDIEWIIRRGRSGRLRFERIGFVLQRRGRKVSV